MNNYDTDKLLTHMIMVISVRYQVLTAASLKITVFWDSLVEVYRRFRGAYCLHHQGDDRSLKRRFI
jgi:hypothetical protein